MTSKMSGLASLALAMAQLDQVSEVPSRSPATISEHPSVEATRTTSPESDSSYLTGIPFPKRRGFGHNALRIVSSESDDQVYIQQHLPQNDHAHNDVVLKIDSEDEDLVFVTPQEDPPPPPAPTEVITQVEEADVLCGRGGETNNHPGNIQYRNLVKQYQRLYLKAKRRDKPKIARQIVDTVRRRNGRFLKKDASFWRDVGNNKAREKTSQALREGAPELRDGDDPDSHYELQQVCKKRKLTTVLPDFANLVSPTPSSGSFQDSHYGSPGCPATVSADDDDNKLYISMPSNKKMVRGPRLAILKARLMSEQDY